jgi:hypothetical protein
MYPDVDSVIGNLKKAVYIAQGRGVQVCVINLYLHSVWTLTARSVISIFTRAYPRHVILMENNGSAVNSILRASYEI